MWLSNALVSEDWLLPNMTCFLFFNVMWGLEDKKDVRKLSNIFTFWGSSLITITAVWYIMTGRPEMAILCHSIFYNHMLFELLYGYMYFPQYMHGLTTYAHHFVYLLFEYILIWETCYSHEFVFFFPQEFPTFLLACKRYFGINSEFYNLISLVSFIFFRFVYFFSVSYHYRWIIQSNISFMLMFLTIALLQSKWCLELLLKTLGKLPFGAAVHKSKKVFKIDIPSEVTTKTKFPCNEISFASSGWMQMFQCGAGKYIQENYDYKELKMVGTSGGALIACALCCDVSMDTIFGEMMQIRKIYNNNIFMMCKYTKENIKKMLPDTCIELINNRLTIVCSKFENFTFAPFYKNAFANYEDVLKYLHATIHIPMMDGCLPHEVDGQFLYDGLLTDCRPQTVPDCIHVDWDRTCSTRGNIMPEIDIPMYWCVFPPNERILHLLYCHGYYQAQSFFLQKTPAEVNLNAHTILVELREELDRVKKMVSNVGYLIKGGIIFCGCFYVSNLVFKPLN